MFPSPAQRLRIDMETSYTQLGKNPLPGISQYLSSFFLLPYVHLSALPMKSCSSAGIASFSLSLAPLTYNCFFLEFLLPTACSTLCRESDPPQGGVQDIYGINRVVAGTGKGDWRQGKGVAIRVLQRCVSFTRFWMHVEHGDAQHNLRLEFCRLCQL